MSIHGDVERCMSRDREGIFDLIDNAVTKAATELPCLRIATTVQERAVQRTLLLKLVEAAFESALMSEPDSGFSSDKTFMVTVTGAKTGDTKIEIGVSLASTRVLG